MVAIAIMYLRVFRVVVVGMCVLAAAWGWWAHIDWMLAAAVCIGLGELLETSYYLVVLGWGRRTGRLPTLNS